MVISQDDNFIDAGALSLDEWLDLLRCPPPGKLFLQCAFPSDRHRDEFLATLARRPEEDFFLLLRNFLIHSGTFGLYDDIQAAGLPEVQKKAPDLFHRMMKQEYFKRLVLRAQSFPGRETRGSSICSPTFLDRRLKR